MSWVKLDDRFYAHPKVRQAGAMGLAVHVAALCYASQYLTDGFIPEAALGLLIDGGYGEVDRAVEALMECGLWEQAKDGYTIHDYLDYNPSRAQVLAEREQLRVLRAEVGRRGAAARWSKNGTNGKRLANAMANGCQTDGPVPDPVPQKKDSLRESKEAGSARPSRVAPAALTRERGVSWAQEHGLTTNEAEREWDIFESHYAANGWKQASGRPIVDRWASWTGWVNREVKKRGEASQAPRYYKGGERRPDGSIQPAI